MIPNTTSLAKINAAKPTLAPFAEAAKSSWFVPSTPNWANVESANVLQSMLSGDPPEPRKTKELANRSQRADHADPERHANPPPVERRAPPSSPPSSRPRVPARRRAAGPGRAGHVAPYLLLVAGARRDRRRARVSALPARRALVPAVRAARADRAQGHSGSGSTTTARSSATASSGPCSCGRSRSPRSRSA